MIYNIEIFHHHIVLCLSKNSIGGGKNEEHTSKNYSEYGNYNDGIFALAGYHQQHYELQKFLYAVGRSNENHCTSNSQIC